MPTVLVMNPDTAKRLGLNSVASLLAYAKKFGPAGLPPAVLARLNAAFVAALQAPETRPEWPR